MTTQSNETPPEPLKTGVDPKQGAAAGDFELVPENEKRSYGSLSEVLELRYLKEE